jgi:hypothetical protein
VGVDSDIEIASITFETPIYISPPTKVKRLGVIHDIIMNIHDQTYDIDVTEKINIGGFDIFVYYNTDTGQYNAELLDTKTALATLNEDAVKLWQKNGADLNWRILLDQYAGKFRAGSTQIFLEQATGNYIVGTVALNPADETKLVINFDQDTYNTNTLINGVIGRTNVDAIINPETYNPGTPVGNPRYLLLNNIGDLTTQYKEFKFIPENKLFAITTTIPYFITKTVIDFNRKDEVPPGTTSVQVSQIHNVELFVNDVKINNNNFDIIEVGGFLRLLFKNNFNIDPGPAVPNVKYIVEFISKKDADNSPYTWTPQKHDSADAWKNQDGSDTIAKANDIIEWSGTHWVVVLDSTSSEAQEAPVYTTNLRTGVQYKFEDSEWTRAFEGEYQKGSWRIVL